MLNTSASGDVEEGSEFRIEIDFINIKNCIK